MEGAMRRRKEAGQAIILTAAALVVLIGFMGFAIDMGVARYEKRIQQTAADAAALAGASNLGYGGVTAAGQDASESDGFQDNGGGNVSACGTGAAIGTVCVQINNPPAAGPHASDPKYVEALVAAVHPTYFARILGINKQAITARAVATNLAGPPGSNSTTCWLSLGAPSSMIEIGDSVKGTPQVNAQYCTIEDNGNLCTSGTAIVNAGSIAVSGAWGGLSGGGGSCTGGTVSPQPVTGVPAVGDPVAGNITDPCPGGTGGLCTTSLGQIKINSTGSCSGGGCSNVSCNSAAQQCTVNPGTYDSICINVNSGTTVNFASGLYVMTGGSTCNAGTDFSVNAQATICNSSTPCSGMPSTANDGVTFYMAGSGSVNIAGGATSELTAPNSGTYEGILFYQDPTDTATASIEGNANSFYQGALYFPTARLVFGGTSGTFNSGAAYTFLIANYTTVDGTATIDINSDVSGLSGGGGPLVGLMTSARLVE
jgi:hypothetical protein